jgi:hypothetical protein
VSESLPTIKNMDGRTLQLLGQMDLMRPITVINLGNYYLVINIPERTLSYYDQLNPLPLELTYLEPLPYQKP